MAHELPTDLIKQIQISTRAQAGLFDYDPGRASEFPALPSLSEYVTRFHPSPPHLRCKHCKGRFLRDVQSLLCIYCSSLNDVAFPGPISFKDTFGYSWLLQSLHLDGSELVEKPIEKNEPRRGQNTPIHKIPLYDFLNLKISRPIEPEKPGENVEESSSLRWAGVELDDFFLELKREKGSIIPEQPVSSDEVKTEEIKPVVTHDNLSLFQHVQPSGPAFPSSDEKGTESSGWQADFQLADTGNQLGTSQSLDASGGSTFDLSTHMDSVFGSGKDLKDENSAAPLVSVNQRSDDFWNSGPEAFQQAGNFDSTVSTKDTQKQDNFKSPSTVDLSAHMDSVFGSGKDLKDENSATSSVSVNQTSDDFWSSGSEAFQQAGNFDPAVSEKNTQKQNNFKSPTVDLSAHIDSVFGSGIDFKNENSAPSSVPVNQTSVDFWNNGSQVYQQTGIFYSTLNAKGTQSLDNFNNPSTSTDWFQGDEWQTNRSNTTQIGMSNKNDDFDEWNDFTGSSGTQEASRSAWTEGGIQNVASHEKPSELNLFSSHNKLDTLDFNSFSEPDLFSGLSSTNHVAVEVSSTLSGDPSSDRVLDAISMPDDRPGPAGHDVGNVDLDSSTQPKDDVQMLISQMHDLSFMLENGLSVPPKSDKS